MKKLLYEISKLQLEEYKVQLHKKLFWLIIYKDEATCGDYPNLDFDKYFLGLMKELNGFNKILCYPVEMLEIMNLLQAAYDETLKDEFNYPIYRKLVFDAQALVDKLSIDRSK